MYHYKWSMTSVITTEAVLHLGMGTETRYLIGLGAKL